MVLFKRWCKNTVPTQPNVAPVAAPKSRARRLSRVPVYMLVVDESGSTSCTFRTASGRTTRITAIRRAAQSYLYQLAHSNSRQLVGLIGFSDTATLYHRLTPAGTAVSTLHRAFNMLHPQSSTNLSAGLALALEQLTKVHTSRGNIVVITDGAANVDRHRLRELTQRAKTLRVRIFTIGVGNNRDSDYDRKLLTRIARSTGGRFSSAHNFETLQRALHRIN